MGELFRANTSTHTSAAVITSLASNVSAGATSFTLASGAGNNLPTPTGGDFFWLRLGPNTGGNNNGHETVRVTARSGDVCTCDALGNAWSAGDTVVWAVAGETLENLTQHDMLAPALAGGRLTLATGDPFPITDQIAKTNLYYTPYKYNRIGLYDGTQWHNLKFSEASLTLSGLTSGKPYDVFGYLSSGALTLELLAWTNNTTRATALVQQDGVWSKSGAVTRRWLGTIFTTGTNTTEDSAANRFVFNADNRVMRYMGKVDTGGSHTYSTNIWRPWQNSQTTWQLQFILGEPQSVHCILYGYNSSSYSNLGLGIDTSLLTVVGWANGNVSHTNYIHNAGSGYHFFVPLEYGVDGGTYNVMQINTLILM